MKLLDRYIVKSMLLSYGICIGIALSFYSIIDLFNRFHRFIDFVHGLQKAGEVAGPLWWWILRYYLFSAPLILYNLSPIITLMAAMFTITYMVRTNELILLKACGIHMYRLFYPLMGFAVASALIMLIFSDIIIPKLQMQIEMVVNRVNHTRGRTAIISVQYRDLHGRLFYIGRYYPQQMELQEIRVIIPYPGAQLKPHRIIEARVGKWSKLNGQHCVHLFDGREDTYDRQGALVSSSSLPSQGKYLPTNLRDQKLTHQKGQNFDMLSSMELWQKLQKNPDLAEVRTTLYNRWTFPLSNLLLLLLGVPWLLRQHTRNFFVGAAICAVVAAAFYGLHIACINLGHKQFLQPLFAACFPLVLFGSVGVSFLTLIHT